GNQILMTSFPFLRHLPIYPLLTVELRFANVCQNLNEKKVNTSTYHIPISVRIRRVSQIYWLRKQSRGSRHWVNTLPCLEKQSGLVTSTSPAAGHRACSLRLPRTHSRSCHGDPRHPASARTSSTGCGSWAAPAQCTHRKRMRKRTGYIRRSAALRNQSALKLVEGGVWWIAQH
ncbi:hypothetical protein RRG08_049633, partial [Elysia crispata]